MKRKIIIPALLALLIPSAAFLAAYLFVSGESYYCSGMYERIALTSEGFAYVAYNENGRPEILKFDPGGGIAGIYSGIGPPWSSVSEVSYINGMFNCGGTVFAVEFHLDAVTGRTLRQTIYTLDEDLGLTRFFTYYGEDSPQIAYLTADNGALFVTMIGGGGQKAIVDAFDLTGGAPAAPTESLEFASPFNDRFCAAVYTNGSLYASTMSGEILRCSGGLTVNVLNSPARGYRSCGIIEALGAYENGLFFFDAMDGLIYDINASGKLRRQDNPVALHGEHAYALAEAGEYKLALITKEPYDVMRISLGGAVTAEIGQPRLSPALTAKKAVPYAVLYAAASLAAILLIFVIFKAFQKSRKLLTKFLFIITPLTLLAFAGFEFLQYIQLQDMLVSERDALSRHYNRLVADSISYNELDFIQSPQEYKSGEYLRLEEKLRVDYGGDEDGVSVQNNIFIIRGGVTFTGISLEYPCFFPAGDLLPADMLGLFNDCANLGLPVTESLLGGDGNWSVTVGPIKNGDDQLTGYVMTRVSQNDIAVLLNANRTNFARLALMIILPLIVLLTLIFRRALHPLAKLRAAMQGVLAGNYETRLDTVTKDEFLGINLAFNKMCSDLKTQMYKLERISDSYYRFVPRNILPVLGKQSILDVNYGDSKRLSACCCALCAHNLPELQAAGADEDFLRYIGALGSFINGSLKRFGGVLMSSEMDLLGLLAIFPYRAENPSFGVCEAFAETVRQFCLMEDSKFAGVSPKITMMLHNTGMLYGITGVDDAAFPFLLSDGVDFIMRVVPLFEGTHTQIVLTQDILPGLSDTPVMEIGWRETPDGKECKLYIPRDGKSAADETFSKGLDLFYSKDFYGARSLFSSVWRDEPANGIARWYALAADKYLSYPHQFVNSQLFGTDVYQINF